jgi:hypothetical protein
MWTKDGGTEQEFKRDNYACVQESRTTWGGGGTDGLGVAMVIGCHFSEAFTHLSP